MSVVIAGVLQCETMNSIYVFKMISFESITFKDMEPVEGCMFAVWGFYLDNKAKGLDVNLPISVSCWIKS